jgi:hypothetical protein
MVVDKMIGDTKDGKEVKRKKKGGRGIDDENFE